MKLHKCNRCSGVFFEDQTTNIKVVNDLTQIKLYSLQKKRDCNLQQWNNLQHIIDGLRESVDELIGGENKYCICQYPKLLIEAKDRVSNFEEMKARSDKLGYMHKEQFEKTKATLQNNPFPNANQEFMSKDEQKKIEKEGDWMQLEALLKRDS